MGTVNLLEAVRSAGEQVRAVVVVTSDKCYEQTREDRGAPFAEGDRLGGADPYSSSKACAELVAEAYRRSYFSATDGANAPAARIASARAGNVIGGGDWGEDRLLADAARAVESAEPLRIRNPSAVRPWQHVLNPLSGYLRLAEALHADSSAARAWNFGPPPSESREVRWVVDRLSQLWRGAFEWEPDERPHPAEAAHLQIDSQAAERQLGWRPAWDLERALESFVQWHDAHRSGAEMRAMSLDQIQSFDESL
jgi:CDP-glucose 4,6-dehydratase